MHGLADAPVGLTSRVATRANDFAIKLANASGGLSTGGRGIGSTPTNAPSLANTKAARVSLRTCPNDDRIAMN